MPRADAPQSQPVESGRLHISRHVGFISFGIIIGAALAPFLGRPLLSYSLFLILSFTLLALIIIKRSTYLLVVAILLGLMVGMYRGQASMEQLQSYDQYFGKYVVIEGKVSQDVSVTANGDQKIQIVSVKVDGRAEPGALWLKSSASLEIKRSDLIKARGVLRPGFGSYQGSINDASISQVTSVDNSDLPRQIRDWFADAIKRVIPEPAASLGIGFLTGQKNSLPEDLDDKLRILGLTHIVVASGYNLTILVRLMRRSFAKVSKYLATISGMAMAGSFILITGLSPSMSRAGLVTALSLLAWYFGRIIHPLVLLSFSAAITVLIKPSYVWGDMGWYLSFAAFFGVIVMAPLIREYFFKKKKQGTIKQIFTETVCAQIATLPLVAFTFGHYAALAIPANLLILPTLPFAMLATFVSGVASLAYLPIAGVFSKPAEVVLAYIIGVVNRLAELPIADSQADITSLHLIIGYVLIATACIYMWRKTKHDFNNDSIIE